MSQSFDRQCRGPAMTLSTVVLVCLSFLPACASSRREQTGATDSKVTTEKKDASVKRYTLTGRVVSIDKPARSINVDGDEIPGFMAAMNMPYQVKDAKVLEKLSPGDRIKAEIVLADDGAYLENIALVQKTPPPNPRK